MADPVEPLILDLLEWLAAKPRLYSEALRAWRTSCPRLPVWEEANERGYVEVSKADHQTTVCVSASGMTHLRRHRADVRRDALRR